MIPVPLPAVLGHEGCGIVEKVGEGVTEFQKGDHVVFSFGYCGHCKNCLAGRPYACENFNAINFGGVMSDGTKRLSKDGREISSFSDNPPLQPIPLSIRTASLKWMRIGTGYPGTIGMRNPDRSGRCPEPAQTHGRIKPGGVWLRYSWHECHHGSPSVSL